MNFIFITGIFVFSLFFRNLFRFCFKKHVSYDAYYHLNLINLIKKKSVDNLIEEKKFIKPYNLQYPWLMHYILSKLPKKLNQFFIERYTNSFLDSLFIIFLFLITYYLTKSNIYSLILCFLYLFTPCTFTTLINGPRTTSLTPRLLGEILGSLTFIFEYLYFLDGSYVWLIIAIISAGFSFLSSKFSFQAVVLISCFIFLFTHDVEYLIVLISSTIFCIFISQGTYFHILKNQILNLKWYFVMNLKQRIGSSSRNSLKNFKKHVKPKNIKNLIKFLFSTNTIIIALTRFPIAIFSLYLIFESYKISNNLDLIDYIILSSFCVFCISSLKWFLFIGEAERYLNYVIFFILLKCTLYFSLNSIVGIFFISYGVIYYICELYLTKNFFLSQNDQVISWLNKCKKRLRIATIPYHLGGWRIVYETKHMWLFHLGWKKNKKKYLDKHFLKVYPILDIKKAKQMIKKYNLNYILFDYKVVNSYFGKNFKIDPELGKIKISKNVFAIYLK